jgi:hypothetical protein
MTLADPPPKSFGFPLPSESFGYYAAGRTPVIGSAAAATGFPSIYIGGDFLTLRVFRWQGEIERITRFPSFGAIANDLLPWKRLARLQESPDGWESLDKIAGDIWRFGPRPIARAVQGEDRDVFRIWPCASLVPVVALQLAARLPRVELFPGARGPDEPIPIKFNGGFGFIHTVPDHHFDLTRIVASIRIGRNSP